MNIGIDLDECLSEYVFGFLNYYNDTYNTNFHFNDVKDFGFWKLIGGTREEAINIVSSFYKTSYFKELPVVFGSRNTVEELKKFSELFVVTSRPNDIINKTNQWIDQHFHNKFSKIIFTNELSRSGERKRKLEICKNLRLDFLVEDNIEYALDCARTKTKVFLLDKPWNQSERKLNEISRVYNWNEILEWIEEIKNGK
ncbi:MAG: hypothetical protein AABW90_01395 [Nanoarchaeota archaeon]